MCGIAGFVSANREKKGERLVRAIVESQIHRGPDFQAVVPLETEKGEIVLGHNRLSIIDLSSAAHQPQYDESGQISIVLNGEFYNYIEIRAELTALGHQFRTNSDVEVLIQSYKEWGRECLSRVNGMFAFALCDLRDNTVWLVRDRFGVKPLFYRASVTEIVWASSGKVIAEQYGLKPNLKYIYKGVTTWNFDDSSEDSPYDGLTNLPGGHQVLVTIENGKLKIEKSRWYDLDARATALREEINSLNNQEIAERLVETFSSSCELRMRADVPVAVALSGGLDSGAVASWVAKDHPEVKGFSFGDPSDSKTEGPMAKLLADRAGIDITFIKPEMQTLIDGFGKTLEAQDAPFVSFAQVAQYLVAEQVAAEGFKVLLGGQGGDEGFMGYRKYFLFALKEMIAQKRFVEAASLGANLIPVFWAERASMGIYWRHRKRFQNQEASDKLAIRFPDDWAPPEISYRAGQPAWRRQMLDITDFSLPTLLRYEDRNSMAHTIETRLPFLDYRIIELGLALPERLKIHKGFGKWAIRDMVKGLIPDEIRVARYKMGFNVDQGTMIRAGLGDKLRGWLSDELDKAKEFTEPCFDPQIAFSDDQLVNSVRSLPELLSLIWLSRRS